MNNDLREFLISVQDEIKDKYQENTPLIEERINNFFARAKDNKPKLYYEIIKQMLFGEDGYVKKMTTDKSDTYHPEIEITNYDFKRLSLENKEIITHLKNTHKYLYPMVLSALNPITDRLTASANPREVIIYQNSFEPVLFDRDEFTAIGFKPVYKYFANITQLAKVCVSCDFDAINNFMLAALGESKVDNPAYNPFLTDDIKKLAEEACSEIVKYEKLQQRKAAFRETIKNYAQIFTLEICKKIVEKYNSNNSLITITIPNCVEGSFDLKQVPDDEEYLLHECIEDLSEGYIYFTEEGKNLPIYHPVSITDLKQELDDIGATCYMIGFDLVIEVNTKKFTNIVLGINNYTK